MIFHAEDWADVSEGAKTLIRRILVSDPQRRVGTAEVLADTWLLARLAETGVVTAEQQPLDRRRLQMLHGGAAAELLVQGGMAAAAGIDFAAAAASGGGFLATPTSIDAPYNSLVWGASGSEVDGSEPKAQHQQMPHSRNASMFESNDSEY
eukprot:SAG11_NODE_2057_length_3875_cov_3.864936_4_plen_151_part_00